MITKPSPTHAYPAAFRGITRRQVGTDPAFLTQAGDSQTMGPGGTRNQGRELAKYGTSLSGGNAVRNRATSLGRVGGLLDSRSISLVPSSVTCGPDPARHTFWKLELGKHLA